MGYYGIDRRRRPKKWLRNEARRRSLWVEKRSQYPSDSPFNDGLGGEDALANSRELHASPCTRLFLSFILFWLAPVLLGLFNSAHPIIRSVEGTSSRLFLLPGTAVGRTDRRPAHWLSCCYVLRVCEWRGGVPAAPSLGTERRVRDPTSTREGGPSWQNSKVLFHQQ